LKTVIRGWVTKLNLFFEDFFQKLFSNFFQLFQKNFFQNFFSKKENFFVRFEE